MTAKSYQLFDGDAGGDDLLVRFLRLYATRLRDVSLRLSMQRRYKRSINKKWIHADYCIRL